MTVHLVKLCVGVDRMEQMFEWVAMRHAQHAEDPSSPPPGHVTRMTPKRKDELLAGGSLYWVIQGQIQIRQKLLDIVQFTDNEGIGRCRLVLDAEVVPTRWQPKRPFQGWRYLKAEEAPPDFADIAKSSGDLPEDMRKELSELGLL